MFWHGGATFKLLQTPVCDLRDVAGTFPRATFHQAME